MKNIIIAKESEIWCELPKCSAGMCRGNAVEKMVPARRLAQLKVARNLQFVKKKKKKKEPLQNEVKQDMPT